MNLQTKISLAQESEQINYASTLLLFGSCFTENIGEKLNYFNFNSTQNPFGILYHPLAVEKLIARAISKKKYHEDDVFFENERWHCFEVHSSLSDASKDGLLKKLNAQLTNTHEKIAQATHLIISLGTAWVYREKISGLPVANCHKVPQRNFSKEILSVAQIVKSISHTIQNIQALNKNIKFVFTVSPVRHLKDGFVENQRSKSHLIAAIHALDSSQQEFKNCSYFPSYELMMDELRDYRFYKPDMVHPNQLAVDYIWEKFQHAWISDSAYETMKKVDTIKKGLAHRPFNNASEQHGQFLKTLESKISYLQQQHSYMRFEKAKE